MIWPACGAEPPAEGCGDAEGTEAANLKILRGGDGSFSLWSARFAEAFHSGRGALREARETFVVPSQLERFAADRRLRVVEVCVGTGTNLAALIEVVLKEGAISLDPEDPLLDPALIAHGGRWRRSDLLPRPASALQQEAVA